MSEYSEVEQPFLQQLAAQGWTVIDQGGGVPQDAAPSLRSNFRQWLLPEVFKASCLADGSLHFHWKCLMEPLTVIDYIVVHELCHLHQRDHTDAFWNEVG